MTYTYDDPAVPYSKGKLTKVYDPSGGEVKEDKVTQFDELQRVRKSEKKIGNNIVKLEKRYDSTGKVLKLIYFPGEGTEDSYSYRYDGYGNLQYLKKSSASTNLVVYSNYTALGQPRTVVFPKPNNVTVQTTYTYYPQTGRLNTLVTQKTGSSPQTYQNLAYQYDPNGNISILTDTLNGITHAYAYDDLDRLTSAVGTGNNPYSQSYSYDKIGNITSKSDVGNYSYTNSNKPHAVRSTSGTVNMGLDYDANGNMTVRSVTGGDRLDIGYNYDNKPSSINKNQSLYVSFAYDGNGQRVKKINHAAGKTTLYFGEIYETRDNGNVVIKHLFAGSRRVVSVRSDEKDQYYHPNHLGSASIVTDKYGNRKERIEYYPFGSYREWVDDDPSFPEVNYTFTDQEEDDELGLYNYKARLYDPLLGRFISADSMVPDPGNLQALNRYAYCLNNPLIYTDPGGDNPLIVIGIIAAAAIVGGLIASSKGGNWVEGAVFAAAISAASMGIGYGVGISVQGWLPSVTTLQAGGSAVKVISAMAGGFAGGAVGGALTGIVSGGDILKSALYGGLIGAAIAGVIQGVIQHSNLGATVKAPEYTGEAMFPEWEFPVCPEEITQRVQANQGLMNNLGEIYYESQPWNRYPDCLEQGGIRYSDGSVVKGEPVGCDQVKIPVPRQNAEIGIHTHVQRGLSGNGNFWWPGTPQVRATGFLQFNGSLIK